MVRHDRSYRKLFAHPRMAASLLGDLLGEGLTGPLDLATLEYPPRDEQNHPIATAPAPFGFSGGGVWWSPRNDESMIDSPERLWLVAINTQWDRRTAILFATKIEYWLHLVRQDFPDTRDEIDRILQS